MKAIHILEKYNYKKLGWLHDSLKFIALFVVLFVLFRFVIGLSKVSGDSMYPTYHDGETVIYSRIAHNYKIGDVVCVWVPSGHYYIKRVVATEGDVVDIDDGQLLVNGVVVDQDYAYGTTEPEDGAVIYPYTISEGDYFVTGDNREVSVDSRTFGEVSRLQIKGKIIMGF